MDKAAIETSKLGVDLKTEYVRRPIPKSVQVLGNRRVNVEEMS
jgi:hypothetical protein